MNYELMRSLSTLSLKKKLYKVVYILILLKRKKKYVNINLEQTLTLQHIEIILLILYQLMTKQSSLLLFKV